MSKKIIKVEEIVDLSVFTKFTKDLGLFQVKARVYSMVSPSRGSAYNHDITEIEMYFSINNKHVNYNGFKTLYTQLYGEDSFTRYCEEKRTEFEEAYFKHTPYKTK